MQPVSSVNMFRSLTDVLQYNPPTFLINIETVTALSNISSIIDTFDGVVHGIVFGRVDFTLSANLTRSQILDLLSLHCCFQSILTM